MQDLREWRREAANHEGNNDREELGRKERTGNKPCWVKSKSFMPDRAYPLCIACLCQAPPPFFFFFSLTYQYHNLSPPSRQSVTFPTRKTQNFYSPSRTISAAHSRPLEST